MTHRASAATVLALLATLLALPPSSPAADRAGVCNVQRKKANLDLVVKDVGGRNVRFSAYKGQVVLLNFWATWCEPCKREIPSLIELHRKYQQRGFAVLGISVDAEVPLVAPFAKALKMNYPVLIGAGREDVSAAFGPFFGYPTSLLVTRDGAICVRHVGVRSKAQLEREISALL